MIKGPNGERRKADVVGNAVLVARIATGEVSDANVATSNKGKSGRAGAHARALKLMPEERSKIASTAANTRWNKGATAMVKTECQKLVDRFAAKAASGLVDVKFFVRNPDEAVHEQVCQEVNRLYEAVERGDVADLDFNDSRVQQ